MKYSRCYSLLLFFVVSFQFFLAQAQSTTTAQDNSFYVVIGAFANPRNAIEWTERAKKNNYKAEYALNVNRNLYYVYILQAEQRVDAVTLAVKLQKNSTYSDTWVYQGLLGGNPTVVKIQEAERKEILDKIEEQSPTVTPEQPAKEEVVEKQEASKPVDGSKPFVFRLKSLSTGEDVIGDVDIYDADINMGRKLASYRGNDTVNVKPVNKSGNLLVVCDVFGYRKLPMTVNFNFPQAGDGVTIEDDKIILTFELVRLKKGDKVTMYNVYFFKDAAIMRPESRYEVNALLDYLKEKKYSIIRLHGHTNGNAHGKIISMGDSDDYFGISTENKTGTGSAVKLSEERARVIQQYLVKQGIDEKRMEIKAWGGKKPVYDDDHPSAAANVRVEVEVLEEE